MAWGITESWKDCLRQASALAGSWTGLSPSVLSVEKWGLGWKWDGGGQILLLIPVEPASPGFQSLQALPLGPQTVHVRG